MAGLAEQVFLEASAAANHRLDELQRSDAQHNGNAETRRRCREMRSRHASANFTYGDTRLGAFQAMLKELPLAEGEEVFVDLGCGAGECVFAAALLHLHTISLSSSSLSEEISDRLPVFRRVLGVDLMSSKVEEARLTWECVADTLARLQSEGNDNKNNKNDKNSDNSSIITNSNTNNNNSSDISNNDDAINNTIACRDKDRKRTLPEVIIMEEDIFAVDLRTVTVVYVCGTCFTADTLAQVMHNCMSMRVGAFVILLDVSLAAVAEKCQGPESDEQRRRVRAFETAFKPFLSRECETSWGKGIATVYQKI